MKASMVPPGGKEAVTAYSQIPSSPDEIDANEDISEIAYLINDLQRFFTESERNQPSDSDFAQSWFNTNFQQSINALQNKLKNSTDILQRSTWMTGQDRLKLLESIRRDFLALKSSMRVAYRQKGTMLCATDWQSPIYAASVPLGFNRLTDGIAEHSLDYKRDGHLDELAYENAFIEEYASHLGSNKLNAYLTNSGMAGFSTVIHWLADEMQFGGQAMAITPMYFENIHLAKAFLPQISLVQPQSSADLLEQLRATRPSLIFVDAVTNCNEVVLHDIDTILDWASNETLSPTAVVIDTTCLPTLFLPENWLSKVPAHVTVIFVESLAKYHQFGMDAVTGGVVMIHASEDMQNVFKKTRARLGTNIVDSSVGSLPRPNKMMLEQRMLRHARNTRQLINSIEGQIAIGDGVIESISWLKEGPSAAPWFTSTCFTLHLRPAFRSIKHYRQFEQRVVELSQQRRLPIALGTSFGFDVSRFYVTAPATRFEDPFLRVSVGTETAAQINTLFEVVGQVNHEMVAAWDSPECRVVPLSATAPQISYGSMPRNEALSAANVFIGENALKDYLCPANYPATPLVELPEDLNPFRKDNVRIFAKIMPLVPLMNIKSIPSFSMMSKAFERGDMQGVKNVIESSSSNTVLSLSVIGKLFGVESTNALVDHSIAPGLVRMLRLFGIEVMMHPGPGHKLYGKIEPRSERARRQGAQPGWMNPGQYSNPDNPEGFAQWLAPDLWAQTDGNLGLLSCALGTCGTMVGVSRALRERNEDIQVIACCPAPGQAVPGPRERAQLSDVQFDWQEVANARYELGAEESFAASIRLLRRGIMGGPSSGMNYAGLLQHLTELRDSGRLSDLIDKETGELWSAFLCCDSPLPHVDEYFEALGEDYFPAVHPVPGTKQAVPISIMQKYAN